MSFAEGYVDVATRIAEFIDKYPDGSLQMDPPKWENLDGQTWLVGRAYAYRHPGDERPGIGHAWEVYPGRTPYTKGSELMVLETSCWGRALAALGIATRAGVATSDEVRAAESRRDRDPAQSGSRSVRATAQANGRDVSGRCTEKQLGMVKRLMGAHHVSEATLPDMVGITTPVEGLDHMSKHEASQLIDALMALPQDKPIDRSRPTTPDPEDPWATGGQP